MDILATGEIYSIAFGDPKNGWKFTVGKGVEDGCAGGGGRLRTGVCSTT